MRKCKRIDKNSRSSARAIVKPSLAWRPWEEAATMTNQSTGQHLRDSHLHCRLSWHKNPRWRPEPDAPRDIGIRSQAWSSTDHPRYESRMRGDPGSLRDLPRFADTSNTPPNDELTTLIEEETDLANVIVTREKRPDVGQRHRLLEKVLQSGITGRALCPGTAARQPVATATRSFDRHLRRPTDHIGPQLASTQNRVRYDRVSRNYLRNTWSFDRVSPCLSGHIDLQLASMRAQGRYDRFQLTASIFCCSSVRNIEKCTMTQRDSHRPEEPDITLAAFYQVIIQAVLHSREIRSLILQPEMYRTRLLDHRQNLLKVQPQSVLSQLLASTPRIWLPF